MTTQEPLPPSTDTPSTDIPPALPVTAAQEETLDLKNIQGDVLSGLPKKTETFYFFQITNATKFRTDLHGFIPLVKSVEDVLEDRNKIDQHKRDHKTYPKPVLIPMVGVNISFSHSGFKKLKIDDAKLADAAFQKGQLKDAQSLNDKGTGDGDGFVPDWEEPFKQELDGVVVVAGDSHLSVEKKLHQIEHIFGVGGPSASISKITTVRGDARPGDLSAHEHFGYLDGVSNPAIIDFDKDPAPGPAPIRAGAIVLGHPGDEDGGFGSPPVPRERDPWMVDGSFLVFRLLFQKVPEFDEFLSKNALSGPGIPDGHKMTKQEGADLLGARLVGRWKSGAPIDIVPFIDDPEMGPDPAKNNNFHFTAEREFQKLCPFAAHVRKTLPRADLEAQGISIEKNRILRRGIQFGPEVTKQEKEMKKTLHGRGLLFACYQSSITNGFQFIQQSWANNPIFPKVFPNLHQPPEIPGFDPIIGQAPPGQVREMSGSNPNDPTAELILDDNWVVPRGGEYFFTPSLKGLSGTIAAPV